MREKLDPKLLNRIGKLEIIGNDRGEFRVKWKEGQEEIVEEIAKTAGMTLDQLIVMKIEEATGKKVIPIDLSKIAKEKLK